MDIWNYLSAVFIGSAVVLIVYSAIRWVGVLGADRDHEGKRKKYAKMCLVGILLLAAVTLIGFIVNFSRNTR